MGAATDDVKDTQSEVDTTNAQLAMAQGVIDVAKAAEARLDAFAATVVAAPTGGGLPPLGQAMLREALHGGGASDAVTHLLYVAVSGVGGEMQIRQRRFRAPVVRYVGTCTISVLCAEKAGDIVFADAASVAGTLTYELKAGTVGEVKAITIAVASPAGN